VPAHTAHSPDDEVALFSMIKWTCFRLSRYKRNGQSGPLFGDQMDLFSFDKNRHSGRVYHEVLGELIGCDFF